MPSPILEALRPFREEPKASALLFDLDGTLAPIAPTPEESRLFPGARETLARLSGSYRLVAIVSGRPAGEARSLVGMSSAVYVGQHGLEILQGGRLTREAGAEEVRPVIARLCAMWSADPRVRESRIRLEDKGVALSLHYRLALPGGEEVARSLAEEALAAFPQLGLQQGKKVFELRPRGTDKGTAAYRLLRGRGFARALYAGDDLTDVAAFHALERLLAEGDLSEMLTFAVGGEELRAEVAREARFVLAGEDAVAGALEFLAGG